jgi:hypothetical protein
MRYLAITLICIALILAHVVNLMQSYSIEELEQDNKVLVERIVEVERQLDKE